MVQRWNSRNDKKTIASRLFRYPQCSCRADDWQASTRVMRAVLRGLWSVHKQLALFQKRQMTARRATDAHPSHGVIERDWWSALIIGKVHSLIRWHRKGAGN